jgi:hypothetical protein
MSNGVGSPEPPRSEGPGVAGAGAGKFSEVEREEIAVQFVRVPDGLEHIRRAWDELEAVVALRGRHFYGAFDPVANDYRACVEVRAEDELAPGLESGTLPGGRYLRARLRGEPPGVYERIGPTFDDLTREAKPDTTRPSLEHYRRYDEIDLLLPI